MENENVTASPDTGCHHVEKGSRRVSKQAVEETTAACLHALFAPRRFLGLYGRSEFTNIMCVGVFQGSWCVSGNERDVCEVGTEVPLAKSRNEGFGVRVKLYNALCLAHCMLLCTVWSGVL